MLLGTLLIIHVLLPRPPATQRKAAAKVFSFLSSRWRRERPPPLVYVVCF